MALRRQRTVPGFKPFVYGLIDPADPKHVRYVGMAPSRASRPYQHMKAVKKFPQDTSYFMNWLRKLQSEEREYRVLILEELPEGTSRHFLGFVEKCYIESLRRIGHKLTNVHEGGWGGATTTGRPCSPELKQRLRDLFTGHPLSEEHKAALRHPWTSARRAAHKSHNKNRPWSEARRAAAKEGPWNKGLVGAQKVSDETRALQSAMRKGRKHSEATLQKMRDAWKVRREQKGAEHAG